MQEAMKEFEKQMEGMDPKQREMMVKMLKDKMPPGTALGSERPKPEFRKTDKKETKGGYPCVRYDVYLGEEKSQELWVTEWNNIKGSKELVAVFQDMAAFYSEMLESLEEAAGGLLGPDRNPMEEFANIDGFPVVSRAFSGGALQSETILKSVEERDLDPEIFEAPKGYKRRQMGR
jgi:hypothetical protein